MYRTTYRRDLEHRRRASNQQSLALDEQPRYFSAPHTYLYNKSLTMGNNIRHTRHIFTQTRRLHAVPSQNLNVNIAITEPLKIASQSRLRISFTPSNRSRLSGQRLKPPTPLATVMMPMTDLACFTSHGSVSVSIDIPAWH